MYVNLQHMAGRRRADFECASVLIESLRALCKRLN